MDSYLVIAERILRKTRQPLSAREILTLAYATNQVPTKLHGRTQHKTLQARLSEDILQLRERSSFFRTEPGRFFLREFINDNTISASFRIPIAARRRQRELPQRQVLAINWHTINDLVAGVAIATDDILRLLKKRDYQYVPSLASRRTELVIVWSFAIVVRDNHLLTYRHGRYRENRDSFLKKRSVGFFAPIVAEDLDLFNHGDHGIQLSALRTLAIDLDIPREVIWKSTESLAALDCFLIAGGSDHRDLLGVVRFNCPNWFEPLKRRLAINDLRWHNLAHPFNHLEDFDPWSQLVLENARLIAGAHTSNEPPNKIHIRPRRSVPRIVNSGQRSRE